MAGFQPLIVSDAERARLQFKLDVLQLKKELGRTQREARVMGRGMIVAGGAFLLLVLMLMVRRRRRA